MSNNQCQHSCPPVKVQGRFDKKYQRVVSLLEESLTVGWDIGASVHVQVDGQPVVDIVGGFVDPKRQKPLQPYHVNLIMSNGKVLESMGVVLLVDRGLVELQAPIARYWPEFLWRDITLQDLLSHRSGSASVWARQPTLQEFQDRQALEHFLATTPMVYPRGSVQYRGWASSLYLDAVCRRVDPKGRSLYELVQEDIFEPLGEPLVCPPLKKVGIQSDVTTPVYGAQLPALVLGLLPQAILPRIGNLMNPRMTLGPDYVRLTRAVLWGTTTSPRTHPSTQPTIPSLPMLPSDFNNQEGFLSYTMLSSNCMSNARGLVRAYASFFDESTSRDRDNNSTTTATKKGIVSAATREAFLKPLEPAFDEFLMRELHYTAAGLGLNILGSMPHNTHCTGWYGIGWSTLQHCSVSGGNNTRNHTVTYAFISNVFFPVPYLARNLLAAAVGAIVTEAENA
ncbi:Glycosyl hydrolases family 43 [Seminavis robusta]|uniref:Glycosyl hydrolases family 43 n=1 Tax=Seminavis robusta TaxID=568900 RepID=A0A9N8ESX1_9STRA|nr:Glycosyl hydrolases family 43 [Seminavis robusta]|eukprot:Sro2010_g310790.1 Glycosyl hydrolases family 43 (452) ;mRNA; r:4338-5845